MGKLLLICLNDAVHNFCGELNFEILRQKFPENCLFGRIFDVARKVLKTFTWCTNVCLTHPGNIPESSTFSKLLSICLKAICNVSLQNMLGANKKNLQRMAQSLRFFLVKQTPKLLYRFAEEVSVDDDMLSSVQKKILLQ